MGRSFQIEVRRAGDTLSAAILAGAFLVGAVAYSQAAGPLPLSALQVYSHNPRTFADRSWGPLESTDSLPWKEDPSSLYYLQVSKGSSLDSLRTVLKTVSAPGLDLSGHADVTDAAFEALVPALGSSLRYLELDGTGVTDRSAAVLNKLPELRVLSLNSAVTDRGLALVRLPKLEQLTVGSGVTSKGVPSISTLKSLRRLDLSKASVDAASLKALSGLNLDQLRLGALAGDGHMLTVARMRGLGQLDLASTRVSDNGLKSLGALKRIHTLFAPPATTDAGAKAVGRLTALRRLDLSHTKITDMGVGSLRGLVHLEELSLAGTGATDAAVESLLQLKGLRVLDLNGTRITSRGIERLAQLQGLQVLGFSSQGSVKLKDLRSLAPLQKLRTLVVNGRPANTMLVASLKRTGVTGSDTALALTPAGAALPGDTPAESLPVEEVAGPAKRVFAGLRMIHEVESELDHVMPGIETARIDVQEDTEANFLGEIEVNAASTKKKSL